MRGMMAAAAAAAGQRLGVGGQETHTHAPRDRERLPVSWRLIPATIARNHNPARHGMHHRHTNTTTTHSTPLPHNVMPFRLHPANHSGET